MNWCYGWILVVAFVMAGGLASASYASAHSQSKTVAMLTGTPRVYDGDSIFFGRVEVRFDAIDAPEHDQACRDKNGKFWACGLVARDTLREMIGKSGVRCNISGTDKYRRLLGTCFAHGSDLNAAMVETGNAIAYHYFSEKYAPQEARARAAQRGIWQDSNFTEPYFCRHFHAGHTCYAYDFAQETGRVAELPLIGRSRAPGAPD